VTTEATRAGIGLRSERGPVLIAVMLSMALIALDSTILATAVPSVVADLGGFSQFPWLFSIYLLAQAVTVPIYGKLSDLFGRKPMLLIGIGLFVAGSALCALAWSLPALIAARAVQGLGAGAIQPVGQTVIGDIYSVAERARVTGYLAAVWGVSSVVGPAVGGLFSEFASWRWIFWINLPLGALAAWLLVRGLHEQIEPRPHRIDYAGALTFAAGLSLIILALLEGGVAWAWTSPVGLSVLAAGLLLLGVFVLVERRAAEPLLPGWALTRRVLVAGNLSALALGALLFGLTSYVPTYAQGVLGTGALVAGFALAALSMGWPIMASVAGRFYLRLGFRTTALIGAGPVIAGGVLIATVGSGTAVWQVALICFLIGCGLGLVNSPVLVALQSAVGWDRRGVVTGTNMFCRALGSALGVAVFGAVANAALAGRPETDRSALMDASHHVFVGTAVAAVLLLLALLLLPRQDQPASV
jgi:EmrB/QacA subfamily drug resistance transporter